MAYRIHSLFDLIEGKAADTAQIEGEARDFERFVNAGIEDFSARPLPAIPELELYRKEFIAYLHWQIQIADLIDKAVAIATDSSLPAAERGKKVQAMFLAVDPEERAWKTRVNSAARELRARINK